LSQNPPPYPPQQYPYPGGAPVPYYRSADDLLRPAKRAGVVMIVLGVLFVIIGLLYAAVSYLLGRADIMSTPEGQAFQQRFRELESQMRGVSVETLLLYMGGALLAVGAVVGTLGVLVRSGRRGPVITSLVVTIGLTILVGLMTLGSIANSLLKGVPADQLAGGLCVSLVPLVLLIMALVWLIQAARAAPGVARAQQQVPNQPWPQYGQQQYYQPPGPPAPGPPPGAGGYHQYPAPPPPPSPPSSGPEDRPRE
jgi:hypothetical protein